MLIPQPSYVSYEPCAVLAGAKPVIINLKEENEFRLTAEELFKRRNGKNQAVDSAFSQQSDGRHYGA